MNTIAQAALISQGALNLWTICPRKFRHQYLDGFNLPPSAESKAKMELGEKFHLLMQQQELGMNVSSLAGSDLHLERWLHTFALNPPITIKGDRFIEHVRTLEFQVCILTAVYDLLILGTEQAQIVDWKTHDRTQALAVLESNWQTRLYLYILATTTSYEPEQISMTYWFANTSESVVIGYNFQKYQQTHADLNKILAEMSEAHSKQDFRQLPEGSSECVSCDFKYRCERETSKLSKNLADISAYPEVAIAELI